MSNEISSKDHLGQEFPSLSAMARHWGLKPDMLWYRLEKGWTMKEALTTPKIPASQRNKNSRCKDHTGREFVSKVAMCAAWGIKLNTFCTRRLNHWPLKKALETPTHTQYRRKEKTA